MSKAVFKGCKKYESCRFRRHCLVAAGTRRWFHGLLKRCMEWDQRSWRALEARSTPTIRAAIRATLSERGFAAGDLDDLVDDLRQGVYLSMIDADCRALRELDPARGTWKTWLRRIARCVTLDWLKHNGRKSRRARFIPLDDAPEVSVAPCADFRSLLEELSDSLDRILTPRESRVTRLLWDEDLTIEEAAIKLRVSPGAIRFHKCNILKKIRGILFG